MEPPGHTRLSEVGNRVNVYLAGLRNRRLVTHDVERSAANPLLSDVRYHLPIVVRHQRTAVFERDDPIPACCTPKGLFTRPAARDPDRYPRLLDRWWQELDVLDVVIFAFK